MCLGGSRCLAGSEFFYVEIGREGERGRASLI